MPVRFPMQSTCGAPITRPIRSPAFSQTYACSPSSPATPPSCASSGERSDGRVVGGEEQAFPSSSPRARRESRGRRPAAGGDEDLDHRARHRGRDGRLLVAAATLGRGGVDVRRGPRRRAGEVQPPRAAPGGLGRTAGGLTASGSRRGRRSSSHRPGGGDARRATAGTGGSSSRRRPPSRRSAAASRSSASSRVAACDELRDHRVVGGADLVSFVDAGVDAEAGRRSSSIRPACGRNVRGSSA